MNDPETLNLELTEEYLIKIAKLCIANNRQHRFLQLSKTTKGIAKLVAELNHFERFFNDCNLKITTEGIKRHFHNHLFKSVFVISVIEGFQNGVKMTLSSALDKFLYCGCGTLIYMDGVNFESCIYIGEYASSDAFWYRTNRGTSQ